MDSMRNILRQSLGRSLASMPELDRLTAAWPVACGKAMATRGHITGFAGGIITIRVDDNAWLDQMRSMRGALQQDLARIAQVPATGIHFESRAAAPTRATPPKPARQGTSARQGTKESPSE